MTIAIQKPGFSSRCNYCGRTSHVYWTANGCSLLRICMRCVKLINGGAT